MTETASDREAFVNQTIAELDPKSMIESFWVAQIADSAWNMHQLIAARDGIHRKHIRSIAHAKLFEAARNHPELLEGVSVLNIAEDFSDGISDAVIILEKLFGEGIVDGLNQKAYVAALPEMASLEKMISSIALRHDTAVSNLYKIRQMEESGQFHRLIRSKAVL